jgi:hypothetical protein
MKAYTVEEREDGFYVIHEGNPFTIFPFLIIEDCIVDRPIKRSMANSWANDWNIVEERCPITIVNSGIMPKNLDRG